MGIHVEDFSEEREAIAYLTRQRKRLWIYYLAVVVVLNILIAGAPVYVSFVTSTLIVLIGAVHFDVFQGRIEARQAWLSQCSNSSELRVFFERKLSFKGDNH